MVFDLDGVVRHYDRAHERDIEVRHGLEAGTLLVTAFGGAIGRDFVCGRLDHVGFAAALAELIDCESAANEFVAMRAAIDHEAVALVRSVQELVPVALLTNGSLRTRQELAESGLHDVFDHVINSAETGIPKPESGSYLYAVEVLGATPAATAFVDDLEANVVGAVGVGLVGHHFVGLDPLRGFLRRHGVL